MLDIARDSTKSTHYKIGFHADIEPLLHAKDSIIDFGIQATQSRKVSYILVSKTKP